MGLLMFELPSLGIFMIQHGERDEDEEDELGRGAAHFYGACHNN